MDIKINNIHSHRCQGSETIKCDGNERNSQFSANYCLLKASTITFIHATRVGWLRRGQMMYSTIWPKTMFWRG